MAAEKIIVMADDHHPAAENTTNPIKRFVTAFSAAYLIQTLRGIRNGFLQLHENPIMGTIREQELGKSTLFFAGPIGVAVTLSTNGVVGTLWGHMVLISIVAGCVAIWNGITIRTKFPQAAAVQEVAGIFLVFAAFLGYIASILPAGLSWIPVVCAFWFAYPVVLALAFN